ncbi:hypothetical protein GGR28_001229 [Lewinella aquimaris]|uniref:Uncharacterized protein n=1 Tax=Neolewinella aquimaris TaxID=1835722 RepID=A0A840ECC0_9BACT|nr:hypothetical protein [Neolewinella aquimaris]
MTAKGRRYWFGTLPGDGPPDREMRVRYVRVWQKK